MVDKPQPRPSPGDKAAIVALTARFDATVPEMAQDLKELLAGWNQLKYLPTRVEQLDRELIDTRHKLANKMTEVLAEYRGEVKDRFKNIEDCHNDHGKRLAILEAGDSGRGGQSKLFDRALAFLAPVITGLIVFYLTRR